MSIYTERRLSMVNSITINGAVLSQQAQDRIKLLQEDNYDCLNSKKETLSLLLIEVIQQRFGDDKWDSFVSALADEIDFLNCL